MKICEMVVGYKVDQWGDAGDEIYCTRPATHLHERDVGVCDSCATALRREGFSITTADGGEE